MKRNHCSTDPPLFLSFFQRPVCTSCRAMKRARTPYRDTSATVTVNYLLINILHDTYVVFIHSYHSTLLLLLFIKYSSVCTNMAEVYIYFVNYCSKLLALRNVERNNDWILLTSGSFSEGNKWKKRLIRIRFEPIFTIGCERNP